MRHVRVGIATAFAFALPLTASSASAQARVEVDEWWTTEAALDRNSNRLLETAPGFDEIEVVDDFGFDEVGYDGARYDDRDDRRDVGLRRGSDLRREVSYDGRVGYVDPRGRVAVDIGNRGRGWNARVVVLNNNRRRRSYAYRPNWRTVRWNVRFDVNRRTRFYDDVLSRGELRDLLGRRTTDRLKDHAKRIDARGRLVGRWVQYGPRGRVLQVRAGGTPVAELIAFGRDRRVDVVRLNVRRWRDDYDRYDRYDRYQDDRYNDDRYDRDDDYRDYDDDRDRRRRRGRN